jgi:hypothetical protein
VSCRKLREILRTNPYDGPDSQFVLNILSPTLQRPPGWPSYVSPLRLATSVSQDREWHQPLNSGGLVPLREGVWQSGQGSTEVPETLVLERERGELAVAPDGDHRGEKILGGRGRNR